MVLNPLKLAMRLPITVSFGTVSDIESRICPLFVVSQGLDKRYLNKAFYLGAGLFFSFMNVVFTKLKTCLCDNDTRTHVEQMPS